MTSEKIVKISDRFFQNLANDKDGSVRAAFDKTFGEDAYEKLASALYNELRAKAGK